MATQNGLNLSLSGKTGTGSFVGSTSPTLVSPTLGAAVATSIQIGATTLSGISGTVNFAGTTSPTFVTPILGAATATSLTFGGGVLSTYTATGTWTPTLTFGGASVGITYTTQTGFYAQIGTVVCVWFTILLSSKGSSVGNASIGTLPVAARTSTNYIFPGAIYFDALQVIVGNVSSRLSSGGTSILMAYGGTGTATVITDANFQNASYVNGSIVYST